MFNFKNKYINIKQHDQSDCAAACLASVCSYYKKDFSVTRIRDIIGTDAYGTSVLGVVQGCEKLNFNVKAIKIIIDELHEKYTLPCLANVVNEQGMSHFVVIYGFKKNKVIIADPAKEVETYSISDFQRIFTGVLILLIPNSDFEITKFKNISMLTLFSKLILPQKKILLTVILMSLVLSIVGILASLFSKILFDEIIPYQLKNTLYIYLFVFGFISIVQIGLSAFRQHILLFLTRKIDIPVLLGYYNHIIKLPFSFFATRKVGDILTRFQDALTIKDIFTTVSISLAMDVLLALISGIVLYNISSMLFLIVVMMVVFNIILIYCFKKPYKKINIEQMEASALLNSHLIESLKNIETIKATSSEALQIEQLEMKFVSLLKIGYREGILSNVQNSIAQLVSILGNLTFMAIGALAIIDTQITMGTLIVFQTLSTYFTDPVSNIVSLQLTFQEAEISMKRLSELMEIEPEKCDETELLNDISLSEDIIIKDVVFKYGSRPPVLNNFNLVIPRNKVIAFVGESGAGKTTISKLLMNFYQPQEGKISIGGYDLQDINLQFLRSKIGYVPQNIEIFSGRIIDNIKLSNPNATYEQVIVAAKKAGCHEFIERLPGRYFGYLEEAGTNLSGGERQRIALARALLKEAELYVFDEATSNLDSISESHVQKMMFEYTKNKTTIIIAHRLSTIIKADCIVVLAEGKIAEQGNHQQLLQQKGLYYHMMQTQLGVNVKENKQKEQNIVSEEITYG